MPLLVGGLWDHCADAALAEVGPDRAGGVRLVAANGVGLGSGPADRAGHPELLEPGEQVVESKLARSLGISQAPVREAVKRLVHDGLVTHLPHHGNFVTEYSKEEADHARVARIALEDMAARIVCGRLEAGYRKQLTAQITAMRDSAERGDIGDFREHDFAFHRTVIEATGNVYLPRMWDLLEPSLRSMQVLSDPGFEGDWRLVANTHQDLLDALGEDSPEAAAAKFVNHAVGLAAMPNRAVEPELQRVLGNRSAVGS